MMFTVPDYTMLISSDVDPSTVALVESAYSILFEAGNKPSDAQFVYQVPYDEFATWLGLDLNKVRDDDGKLNARKIASELNNNPRYRHADAKVDEIMQAIRIQSGLEYQDENAMYKPNHPLAGYKIVIENIRAALLKCIIYKYRNVTDINEFDTLLGRINVSTAARIACKQFNLSKVPMKNDVFTDGYRNKSMFVNDAGTVGDRITAASELPPTYTDEGGRRMTKVIDIDSEWAWYSAEQPDEYDDTDPNYLLFTPNYFLVNRNDTFLTGGGGNTQMHASMSVLINHDKLASLAYLRRDSDNIGSSREFAHQMVNFILSPACNGIVPNASIKPLPDDSRNDAIVFNLTEWLGKACSCDDVIRLVKAGSGDATLDIDWDRLCNANYESYDALRALIDCAESGLANSDDFGEWARHATDYAWLNDHIEPRILQFIASKYQVDIRELVRALVSRPEELIKAITNDKEYSYSAQSQDQWPASRLHGISKYNGEYNGERLGYPSFQCYICKTEEPDELFDKLGATLSDGIYVPLSDEAYEMMIYTESSQRHGAAWAMIDYFGKVVQSLGRFDGNVRHRIFSDITKFITPSVQSLAVQCNNPDYVLMMRGHIFEVLARMASIVPGFKMSHMVFGEAYPRGDYPANTTTPKELLVALRKYESLWKNHGSPHQWARMFICGTGSDEMITEMRSHNPILDHIRDELVRFLKFDNVNTYILFNELYSAIAMGGMKQLNSYVDAFLKPIKKELHCRLDEVMSPEVIMPVIRVYRKLFDIDAKMAIDMFISRDGILSGGEIEYRATGEQTGGKVKKVPVFVPDVLMQYTIANTLLSDAKAGYLDESFADKAIIALIANVLAGKHLILGSDRFSDKDDFYSTIMQVSNKYDTQMPADTPDEKRVVSLADLDSLIGDDYDAMLGLMDYVTPDLAKKICQHIVTPENMRRMVSERDGLTLLLRLSAKTSTNLFARQFASAHQMAIESIIPTLPEDEAEQVRKFMAELTSSTSKFSAVSGSANTDSGTCSYHEANGLKWMDKFVLSPSVDGKTSNGKYSLFTRDEAIEYMKSIEGKGWRLPTSDEIENLGENPRLIQAHGLAFPPTGMMTASGNISSSGICYCWCTGEDGLTSYSVSNNFFEVDDMDVDVDEDRLAIKLVQ